MVNLQDAEGGLAATAVAPAALLLAKPHVLVLTVGNQHVDVSAPGDVGAGSNEAVVEQSSIDCCRRM